MAKKTLSSFLIQSAMNRPDDSFHWCLDEQDRWIPLSTTTFIQAVLHVADQLQQHGIEKGNVVAIMAGASQRWEVVHHAILILGGVVVGIDPGEIPEHLEEIVKIAKIQSIIIDRLDRLDKFSSDIRLNFKTSFIYSQTPENKANNLIHLNMVKYSSSMNFEAITDKSNPEDIATIIFTSGTTGKPKGVAYQHQQIVAAIEAILQAYPELNEKPCHLVCWLPLSNLFQRIVNLCALAGSAQVYFVEKPQKIIEYLPNVSPHIFIAVPRFYEKLYQGFEAKLNEIHPLLARLLRLSLTWGEQDHPIGLLFRRLNPYVFKSFTRLFGHNIRYLVSGSAPMPLWLLKRYHSMGLLILEAYGLSENVVPIAANRASDYRFGSVGKAMLGNEVKLADDDELWVKGIGVFNGYLGTNEPERQCNDEGYLPTGDYAHIDEDGFIRLIGRKSEVFKTSTGRKIAPVAIEEVLKNHAWVEHAVVFGESRKFLVTLIMVGVKDFDSPEALLEYGCTLSEELRKALRALPDYKRPAGMVLCCRSLTVEQQELTANLKLRRKAIYQHYLPYLEALYAAIDDPASSIHQQALIKETDILLCTL